MRAWVLVTLLAPALAGCLGQGAPPGEPLTAAWLSSIPEALLSQPVFQPLPGEDDWFESHDGTTMHASVWRPDEGDTKAPVIIYMTPYLGFDARQDPTQPASKPTNRFAAWLIDHFVPRGYAAVMLDVRGTGDSGGCLEQTGWKEAMDGYVAVERYAAMPWSSGRVGMAGISYMGETQQATAIHAPPHLVTIVPAASIDDGYKWWFHDGVPYWDPWLAGETGYMMDDGLQPPTSAQSLAAYPTRPGMCHPQLALATTGDGTHTGVWDDLDLRPGVKNIRASVFQVHGLQDWNVKPDNVHDWFNHIDAPKMLWLGQWEHNYPWRNTFNSAWSRSDWNATLHRWFDHWLLGIENGVMDLPRVQVQDDEGAWRAERDWPPRDARPFLLHLTGAGALAPQPSQQEARLGYDEQEDLAMQRAAANAPGQALSLMPGWLPGPGIPGLPDQQLPMPQGLRFASDPLERDVRLAGTPTLTVTLACDQPETHLAARLLAIAPNGTEEVIDRGYLSAEHRLGNARKDALVPGQPAQMTLTMYPQDTVVRAGHRLLLWLGPWDDWARPEGNGARCELRLGPGSSGFLALPEVQRDLARAGLPVPMYDWRT